MKHPWLVAGGLLAGSLALSALFRCMGIPFFLAFVIIPFIPFISKNRQVKRCPACGWETVGSERFCPHDATPLADVSGSEKE